ncbi:MAG: hypothetical protein ACNA7O_08760 [Rhodobacterales bacterium]
MSFIRDDAMALLQRWRGVLIGLGVAALGLWWVLTSTGLLGWLGWVVILAGGALAFTGVQRLRFAAGRSATDPGPGVVTITEGQVTYFGPLTGGVVAMSELARLEIDHSGRPAHWHLHQTGQPTLSIPLTATNAGALFDVFATLPGLSTERLLTQMRGGQGRRVVVLWQRDSSALRLSLRD